MSTSSYPKAPQRNNRALGGLILIIVGGMLLLRQFDWFFFPNWLFSPIILIVIGVYIGKRNNFQNAAWIILVLIGSLILLNHLLSGISIWPIAFIVLGIWFILHRNKPGRLVNTGASNFKPGVDFHTNTDPTQADYTVKDEYFTPPHAPTGEDYVDATSIFSSVKKIVYSKDFKGGDIVNVFGGCELDFTQADINGQVVIDITQLFGGVKMIVPAHWQVTTDLSAIFAGFDDKRLRNNAVQSSDKILLIKGVSIFAGIDVRSF